MGLVRRQRDAEDQRSVRISLTPAGKKLADRARDFPACVARASGLADPDMQALIRQLSTLRARIASAIGD